MEANRCLFCYDAPCTKSCPTEINVPKFIKQITTDNLRGSAQTIFISNIFGGGCSRVCPVEKLCEGSCVYTLMHEKPIAIAKLQRYATEDAIEKNGNYSNANLLQEKNARSLEPVRPDLAAHMYYQEKV